MKIVLDDIACKKDLYPFTLTRSAANMRVGILTIREKWEILLGKKIYTISETGVAGKDETILPANMLPSAKWLKAFRKNDPNITSVIIQYPWHIFQNIDTAIREDYELITKKRTSKKISSTNALIGKNIFIEEGAKVEYSILNSSTGPIYIGKNAEVLEGCMIRGPFAMNEGSILKMGTKVYGATTLGPYCTVGGEIKNSVLFGYSNKAHDGYLGDAVIGEWCNLGAGTSNSNIKNTAGQINIRRSQEKGSIAAGIKCGLMMGDYSRAAINTSFNTGTIVGISSNVFCNGFPPTLINNFTWGDQDYELGKALEHIENWKKLKGHTLSEEEKRILFEIYHQKNNNA